MNKHFQEIEIKNTIQQLKDEVSHLENENIIKEEQLKTIKKTYEDFINDLSIKKESTSSDEQNTLNELIAKNTLIDNELQGITNKLNQYNDPNIIFMNISNWDPFYISKFLSQLNNKIHVTTNN